jgi:uncharacterized membrane protein YeiH
MLLAATTVSSAVGSTTISALLIARAFVFAVSGGLAGAVRGLDFFGVVVVAALVGLSGGALRDVLLGIPAVVIFDWRLVVSVAAAAVVAFLFHQQLLRVRSAIEYFDAVGLALFSVVGADISLHHHAGALGAVILGMMTGIGGGVVRDIVLNEVPTVLRSDLYAVPALLGSLVVVIAYESHHASLAWYVAAAAVCLAVRVLGIVFEVSLPRAP